MVAYSFKKQFIKPIKQGTKSQTIRRVGKRSHAKPGDKLQLYFGMRTRQCRKISDAICRERNEVILHFERGEIVNVEVGGQSIADLDQFAIADGFKDITEMSHFWADTHKSGEYTGPSLPLVLIMWEKETSQ